MRIVLTVLLFGINLTPSHGQTACANGRYTADIFTAVTKTSEIAFGRNTVRDYTQGTDTPVSLLLDFYEPSGDTEAKRPLIIFAFGGAYRSGQRQDMDDLCRAFALKGYATATIDYRLVPPGINGYNYGLVFNSRARLADQIVRTISDMKAAVRFFRRDAATANTYRINPEKVFVAGYSAGAITALHTACIQTSTDDSNLSTAFQANGGLEGNTDLPSPNNSLRTYNAQNLSGVFSLAGALINLDVLNVTDPPIYAAHGSNDATVPYNSGPAFGTSPHTLYGGGDIAARAQSIGLRSQLYTIPGGDHGSTRQLADRDAINSAAAAFFQSVVCPPVLPVSLISFTASVSKVGDLSAYWKTASEKDNSHFILQISQDGKSWRDLIRKDAAPNASSGATYEVHSDLGQLSLAGLGMIGLFLLPVRNRRCRTFLLLSLFTLISFSCAKTDDSSNINIFGTKSILKHTVYVRLVQVDLNGNINYSETLAIRAD